MEMMKTLNRLSVLLLCCVLLGLGMLSGCGEAPAGPPRPLVDGDGDGIANKDFGGRDCNDNDITVPGGLEETPGNGKDDNCNDQVDEIWTKTGYWRLTTPSQPTARWDIDVRTNTRVAVQHVLCLQFKFSLTNPANGQKFNITQWQTGLPTSSITFKDNKFEWNLDDPKRTLKIKFVGTIVSPTTMNGTIEVSDSDPQVNTSQIFPFTGRYMTALTNDDAEKEFCNRCYGSLTCKPAE